jgi:hypothetical protein
MAGLLACLAALVPGALSPGAKADDALTVNVVLREHRFAPAEIHVPAGRRVVLHIVNEDPTAEEFDSSALKVEKVIPGGTYGTVWLRPLGAGRYAFMGEFHPDTAQGAVIAE